MEQMGESRRGGEGLGLKRLDWPVDGICLTLWPDEPEECLCRFTGDAADASACPLHSEPRESAVKLTGCGEGYEECPF
jgi:hypothetical protein